MKRALIALSLLGVATAVTIGLVRERGGVAATSYRLVPIARGTVESNVSATGTLGAVSTVQVGTQVSGQIAALYVDFNDHVRKGQLVARLDPTLLQQAVQQADADIEKARADLKQKEYGLDQAKALYAIQGITETDYRTAQYNLAVSQATLKSSQASLERAQQNLKNASIYSPISGVVIERNVDVGQTVAASLSAPQLFLIAEDLKRMQILVSVDESDIGQIQDSQAVRFTVQAYPNRTFTGTVRQVRMQSKVDQNVVNYTVVAEVENVDGKLLPGMTATVSFEVARANDVLTVPNAALRFKATDAMIAAAGGAGTAGRADTAGRAGRDTTGRTGRAGTAGQAGRAGGTGGRSGSSTQLWYLNDKGVPAVMRVRTGLTNGQTTEVSGADLREGMQVIAGLVAPGTAPTAAASPFQNTQTQRGPGRPGGF